MKANGGVDELQLNANSWRINATGNGATSSSQVANMALLRGADIALQNGFKYFVVINEKEWSDDRALLTTGYSFGAVTTSITWPQVEIIVMMFQEYPNDINGVVYETKFICETLGETLDTKCGSIR